MSEFAVGVKVKIVGNKSDHGFEVGDTGAITGPAHPEGCLFKRKAAPGWKVTCNGDFWYVYESDLEVLD